MTSIGFPEIIVITAILGSLLLFGGGIEGFRLRSKGLALVLREFRLGHSIDSKELIFLRARPAGLVGAILSLFGLECETVLTVTAEEFVLDRAGLFGFTSHYAPLRRVASSECKFHRATAFLILAFVTCGVGFVTFIYGLAATSGNDYSRQTAFLSLSVFLLFCSVVATICFLVYKFSKRVVLTIETFGGRSVGLAYKRSIVQGFAVDLAQAIEAVNLLNDAILRQAKQRGSTMSMAAGG